MKIGIPVEQQAPTVTAGSTPPATKTASPGAAATATSATAIPAQADPSLKVRLSNTASTLLTSGSTPEFDAEKVARISKSIADGSFKINPGAIADKLIANAHEVLGKVKS